MAQSITAACSVGVTARLAVCICSATILLDNAVEAAVDGGVAGLLIDHIVVLHTLREIRVIRLAVRPWFTPSCHTLAVVAIHAYTRGLGRCVGGGSR